MPVTRDDNDDDDDDDDDDNNNNNNNSYGAFYVKTKVRFIVPGDIKCP
jgi:hypothetical protein